MLFISEVISGLVEWLIGFGIPVLVISREITQYAIHYSTDNLVYYSLID